MNYSDFSVKKKIKTLMRDLSFYYIRDWFDSIPEEDSDGDIQKAHELVNDKFAKTQIDSFFFTSEFQAILYPAYALLMYYRYNPKFADYVNSIYMNDEQLIDNLHGYFHGELEKRINEAITEDQKTGNYKLQINNSSVNKAKSFIYLKRFANSAKVTRIAAASEDIKVKLAPPLSSEEDINVVRSEIWKGKLRIDFSDNNAANDYIIRIFDKDFSLLKEFFAEAETCIDNTELKVLFIDNCSAELFIGNYWDITKE